jgi:hypothetical protein
MNSWQEKKAIRTGSFEPAANGVRKRPTGESLRRVWKR